MPIPGGSPCARAPAADPGPDPDSHVPEPASVQLDLSFASPVDRRSIYASESRRRALALLSEGLGTGRGFLLLTGDAGTGKSLVLADALAAWSGRASVAWVNASALFRHPLREVLVRFGVPVADDADDDTMTAAFDAYVTEITSREELAVLAIDDAHDLSDEAFHALVGMVEPGPPARRFQVLLVGRPDLETRLADEPLAAVCDRLAVQCRLDPLAEQETERYLRHRVANGSGAASAPSRAVSLVIHALGAGNPRAIDRLVDEAMRRYVVPTPGGLTEAQLRATAALLAGHEPPAEVVAAAEPSQETPEAPRENGASTRAFGDVGPPRAIGASSQAEAREWVSRFIGEQGPPKIGSRLAFDALEAEVNRHEQRMSVLEFSGEVSLPTTPSPAPAPTPAPASANVSLPPSQVEESEPEPAPAPRPRRSSSARRGPSRGHRSMSGAVPFTIAAVLGLLLLAVLLIPRVRTMLPAVGARPAVQDSLPRSARTTSATGLATGSTETGVTSPSIVLTPKNATPAPADTVKKTPVWRGLEVASYLSADRASEEQQRLSTLTGLSGQVIEGTEEGTEVYRVVLGCYRSRSRAEKAANWLLDEGYVTQARTVRIEAPEVIP